MFLMFHVAIWLICFVSSVEVSQLEQSLQKGELTLAELWYRSQPSMDTFALLQHGSVSSVCLKGPPGQVAKFVTRICGIRGGRKTMWETLTLRDRGIASHRMCKV